MCPFIMRIYRNQERHCQGSSGLLVIRANYTLSLSLVFEIRVAFTKRVSSDWRRHNTLELQEHLNITP
jgi:hypothetical protein